MSKVFMIGTTASNLFLFRKDFIKLYLNKGYEVFALVSEYDDEWIEKIENLGAEVLTYKLSRAGLNPISDIKTILEIKTYIGKYKPDLVFSFFTKPVIYGSLAAKLAGISNIVGMVEGLGSPFTDHKGGKNLK